METKLQVIEINGVKYVPQGQEQPKEKMGEKDKAALAALTLYFLDLERTI